MIKKSTLLLLLVFTFSSKNLFSQNSWYKTSKKESSFQKNKILSRENLPEKYSLISLNLNEFKNRLSKLKSKSSDKIIVLPDSRGELKKFQLKEVSYLAPELASKFPMIKSYSAKGIDDPTATAKISLGTNGLHAVIFSGNENTIYIDPYTENKKKYIIYKKSDLKSEKNKFKCKIEETYQKKINRSTLKINADDGKLRTFRIAIACTGEYSQFHLNRLSVSSSASESTKKAAILSAMNTTITRVNDVYERDLGVRMVIVKNNDKLIFLDADTDDLTNNDSNILIDESQQKCDNIIGDANYDIGHTFGTSDDGLAEVGSVCVKGKKASGITGRSQPISDPFDIDFVAHELGHQFGATHTQNNSCFRYNSTAVEPGSGSTIMGYAGICSPNIQSNSDDHFHSVSIKQMWEHIQNSGNCAALSDTGNNPPTASAGDDVSIPKSTPFVLKATATDPQGLASLTYNWEQIDNEITTMPPLSTNTAGPTFRSFPSKASPNRYLPTLSNIVNGGINEWEVIPSVPRELNFSLTVRDNNPGGGSAARDDIKITVTNADAFTVTAPNTNVTWNTGSTQTITWNKGTTDKSPINCKKVNIKLSIDGGLTFPILLKEDINNDGTEDVIIPNNPTNTARIIVEAADNIFYNVNSTNFTINSTIPTFLISNKTDKKTVCNTGVNAVSYNLNLDFVNGFTETVNLSAIDLPGGTTVSFTPAVINVDGDVVMTINNLNGSIQDNYTIIIEGKSATVTQTTNASLKIIGSNFSNITLTTPTNKSNNISINPKFEWEIDPNATSYNIVIATDDKFSNIVVNEISTSNSYILSSPLAGITSYFWYIKPKNDCDEGLNSNISEFTTETPSYCSSSFTDDTGGTEHITNVTFNSINNDSKNDTLDGYEDFTSISTNLQRKQEYPISVTFDTGGYRDHCYVFIDWNQDYIFDKNTERYDLGNKTESIATAELNITVPENATSGRTRMRVIIEYYEDSSPNGDGPCNSDHKTKWGETEDYSINIEEDSTIDKKLFADLKLYPIPSEGKITVSFKARDKNLTIISLFDLRGRLLETQNFSTLSNFFNKEIHFTKVGGGIYFLQIENDGQLETKKIIIK